MASFFSCFACETKSSSVVTPTLTKITPEKPTEGKTPLKEPAADSKLKEDNSYIEDEDRAKTVTTLTFHNSDLVASR